MTFSRFFFLVLCFFSLIWATACASPSIPRSGNQIPNPNPGPGPSDPRPWERFAEIDNNLLEMTVGASVMFSDGSGALHNTQLQEFKSTDPSWNSQVLTFVYPLGMTLRGLRSNVDPANVRFTPTCSSGGEISGTTSIPVYVYYNNQYVDFGNVSTFRCGATHGFPDKDVNPASFDKFKNMQVGDTFYYILVFTDANGGNFKYTTPVMSAKEPIVP